MPDILSKKQIKKLLCSFSSNNDVLEGWTGTRKLPDWFVKSPNEQWCWDDIDQFLDKIEELENEIKVLHSVISNNPLLSLTTVNNPGS